MIKPLLFAAVGAVAVALSPSAHADGLSNCTEDSSKLQAEAQASIDILKRDGTMLGPYETAGTVLQFVNKSMDGVGFQMSCAQVMAMYVTGRENGSFNAPRGPGLS
jgi:hypothetical protein